MGRRRSKNKVFQLKGQSREVVPGQLNWKGRFECELPEGMAWISGAYTGYPCLVEFGRYSRDHISARVQEHLSVPDGSRQAPCPLFQSCGGCKLQHMDYAIQLKEKHSLFLRELASHPFVQNHGSEIKIQASPSEFAFRNKMEFSFSKNFDGEIILGFHEEGSFSRVLDVTDCLIQSQAMNSVLGAVKDWAKRHRLEPYDKKTHGGGLRHLVVRESCYQKKIQVNLVASRKPPQLQDLLRDLHRIPEVDGIFFTSNQSLSDAVIFDSIEKLSGSDVLIEKIGKFEFEIGPRSFFQTNSAGTRILYDVIRKYCEKGLNSIKANPRPKLVDFYCGAGSIGIYLSSLFAKIVGVEEVSDAVVDARKNYMRNDLDPPILFSEKVEKLTPGEGAFKNVDVVVVDPPRSGCHYKARRFISDLQAPVLVYVSCNPKNLVENVSDFEEAGYSIKSIELVDMFPQTAHLEAVVFMTQ